MATALSVTSSKAIAEADGLKTAARASTSNSGIVGGVRTLGATSTVNIAGVADIATRAAGRTALSAGTGRVFFINSLLGNDNSNGLATAATSAAVGPWRTLARLLASDIKAGDSVELACGSVWRETLRLPSNGTATQPIRISAPAAGCTTAPVIDGSVTVAASDWKLKSGKIYQTTLTSAPLTLQSNDGGTPYTEAHHPNRGYLSSDPTMPYLTLSAKNNVTTVSGRQVSTQLGVGADLVLPTGAGLVGSRVRVRTEPYVIDESTITAFNGSQMSLSKPTTTPAQAGWGYLLLGQFWMLDSPGEWHYDPTTRQLSAWMNDSAAPGDRVSIGVLATGVDLQARQYVVIDGLAVRRTGTGIDLRKSKSVQLMNAVVEDTADIGVHVGGSVQALLDANTISRTGSDAINGQGDPIDAAVALTVRNNVIRDSGVLMQGDLLLSLPRRNLAAIVGATDTVVTGNTIINSGYIGVLVGKAGLVENNFIYGACTLQDDCGGIYTGGLGATTQIRGNTVVHARGMSAGMPAGSGTAAQGIYVDAPSSGYLVEDNSVIDTDVGIQLHDVSNSTVRNNRLYGNRRAQLWMQEDTNTANSNGDVFGNSIQGNQLAPTTVAAYGLRMDSLYKRTSGFGTFDRNRYYDLVSTTVAYASTTDGGRYFTLAQWLGSTGSGSTQAVDIGGEGTSQRGVRGYVADGANLISNAALLSSAAGWNTWNEVAPAGKLFREACAAGICLRYVAGGSDGILSSPTFAVQAGRWYRLTLDVATEQEGQTVPLVVRVGGRDYSSVSDRNLTFVAGRAWTRHSVIFQATQTVDPKDKTGLGARVDFDRVNIGKSLSVANMELVSVTASAVPETSAGLVNVSSQAALLSCPYASSRPAACSTFYNLADDQPVNWPFAVAARSAAVLYARDSSWLDSDGDGVPDSQDQCPGTAGGAAVNASGCSFAQR